jgi:hypothetical protein
MFEAPAFVASLDDLTVMGEPVEKRGGYFGVALQRSRMILNASPKRDHVPLVSRASLPRCGG